MKRKITVTTGTRAEYGIMRPILHKINQSKKLELHLIVTGMHLSKKYGLTINEIRKDNFKISGHVNMIPKKDSPYETVFELGKGIADFAKFFKKIKPQINLVLGDRDEMLASAIAAYHLNIPNAHVHGGDRTMGGIDEYTRHAITKISNIHFAATRQSFNRIKKMGENPKYVFLTGSPSIDEISTQKISSRQELEKKYQINFSEPILILLQHPVTTESELSGQQILETLNAIKESRFKTIAITPNSDVGHQQIFKHLNSFSKKYSFISLFSSIPRQDFLGLIKFSSALIGNSSSGMIEGSYFDTPIINIGIRQKDRERGLNVLDVKKFNKILIIKSIKKAINLKKKKHCKLSSIYGTGNASMKITHYLEKIKLDKPLIQKQIAY